MDLSTLSVLPTKAELLADTKGACLPNSSQVVMWLAQSISLRTPSHHLTERNRSLPTNHGGPWRRLGEYVDCHFLLLREDYVAPLREVLTHFLQRKAGARYVIYAMQVRHQPGQVLLLCNCLVL